jgi:hypothetical protein
MATDYTLVDGYRLADQHRIEQVKLTAATMKILAEVWRRTIDPLRLDATFPVYLAAAAVVLGRGRAASDVLARRYYMKVASSAGFPHAVLQLPEEPTPRVVLPAPSTPTAPRAGTSSASNKGKATSSSASKTVKQQHATIKALPAPAVVAATKDVPSIPMKLDAIETSLYVTGPVVVRTQIAKGASLEAAKQAGLAGTLAAGKRIMLDAGRGVLLEAARRDKNIRGWARVSDGDPCAFCAMLISRGPVYRTEASAAFRAHDRCGCSVRLVYRTDVDRGWSTQADALRRLWDDNESPSLSEWRTIYGKARKDPDSTVNKPASPSRAA